MGLLIRLITGGGVAAFFFFAFILMLLWNSLVVGHLGWGPTLSYLQTAGLWLLISLALAWAGIGRRTAFGVRRRPRRNTSLGDEIERRLEDSFSGDDACGSRDDLGDRIEGRIRRGFARWADAEDDTDWSELGGLIERKIRKKLGDWVD
jgi:hypothetical protein